MRTRVLFVLITALLGLSSFTEAQNLRRQDNERQSRGLQWSGYVIDVSSETDPKLDDTLQREYVSSTSLLPEENEDDVNIETGGPFIGPEVMVEPKSTSTSDDTQDLEATKRIIGGSEAQPHSFHSMLLLSNGGGWRWAGCGGTLVSNCHVVTAAHCAMDPSKPLGAVFVNAHRPYQMNFDVPFHFSTVEYVVRHSGFNSTSNEHDIAVIKMEQCLNTTEFPPAIPASPDMNITSDAMTDILGFGKLSELGNMFVNVDTLQKARVPIIPQKECKQYYGEKIKQDMFCGGYAEGGVDACQGDSGSSMTFNRDDNSTVLVGVVSWGVGCGRENSPGVYSSVEYHYDWLSRQICEDPVTNVAWCDGYTRSPTFSPSPPVAAVTAAPTLQPTSAPRPTFSNYAGKSQKQRSSTTFYSTTPMLDFDSNNLEDTSSSLTEFVGTTEHEPMVQFWETTPQTTGCKTDGQQCSDGSECCSGICQRHEDKTQQSSCYMVNRSLRQKEKTRGVRKSGGSSV